MVYLNLRRFVNSIDESPGFVERTGIGLFKTGPGVIPEHRTHAWCSCRAWMARYQQIGQNERPGSLRGGKSVIVIDEYI